MPSPDIAHRNLKTTRRRGVPITASAFSFQSIDVSDEDLIAFASRIRALPENRTAVALSARLDAETSIAGKHRIVEEFAALARPWSMLINHVIGLLRARTV